MPRLGDKKMLRQVAEIRELQRASAENAVMLAAAALRESEALRAERERECRNAEENWLSSLSGPFRFETAPLWSEELLHREEASRLAVHAVERANGELKDRTSQFHIATALRDNAKQMSRKAIRDDLRRLDEKALQNASDRHAQLWSAR